MSEELVQISKKVKPTSSLRIVFVLSIIAALCGSFIALAVQLTKQAIVENQEKGLKQAVVEVIPNTKQLESFLLSEDGKTVVKSACRKGECFYAAYDDDYNLLGVAFEGVGAGYADNIKILFGYNLESKKLIGIKVTESKETPGLGDRITNDSEFLANFNDMSLSAVVAGEHDVEVVKGNKTQPWQISAIAGATVSSKAVAKILTTSGRSAIPIIEANLEVFKRGEE